MGVAITGGNQHWQSQPHHWDLRQRDNQISFSFEIKAFNRLDPDYQVQPDFILDILTHKAYLTGQGALLTDLRSWLGPSQGHLQCQTPRQPPRPPSLNTFEFSKVISWETHKFEHKPCVRICPSKYYWIFSTIVTWTNRPFQALTHLSSSNSSEV